MNGLVRKISGKSAVGHYAVCETCKEHHAENDDTTLNWLHAHCPPSYRYRILTLEKNGHVSTVEVPFGYEVLEGVTILGDSRVG